MLRYVSYIILRRQRKLRLQNTLCIEIKTVSLHLIGLIYTCNYDRRINSWKSGSLWNFSVTTVTNLQFTKGCSVAIKDIIPLFRQPLLCVKNWFLCNCFAVTVKCIYSNVAMFWFPGTELSSCEERQKKLWVNKWIKEGVQWNPRKILPRRLRCGKNDSDG